MRPRGRGSKRSDHAVQRAEGNDEGSGWRRSCPLTTILGERRRRQQQQQQCGERQSGAHGCPLPGTRSRWLRRWRRVARLGGGSVGAAPGGLATAANSGVAFQRPFLPTAELGWGA